MELTGQVSKRDMEDQLLDSIPRKFYGGLPCRSGKGIRNRTDTPGHVDFTYEVSRSLAACEGALLVVDATQGIEAQTTPL